MPLFRKAWFQPPRPQSVFSLPLVPVVLTCDSGTLTLTGQDCGLIASLSAPDQPTGGWLSYVRYEQEMLKRAHEKRKREEDEEDAQRIADERDREIAALLHAQEARDADRKEVERLSQLARDLAAHEAELAFNERVSKALARALTQENISAFLALDREMRRQLEEEEFAVVTALTLLD